ncbi:hypothetical protein Daus18300_003439 [Diaporthe australafricana]|uniref:Uncharacterized protein n=1 Tax=Diaporthe australafricana TaxID=127596 RepID=A0ABR3XG27_9PEZI
MSNNKKWKKALLPALGSRRGGRDPTSRLPASRTVSDVSTAATLQHGDGPSPVSVDDEVDDRVISVLLETSGETDNESQSAITQKARIVAHSQTIGVMPCTENSSVASSPTRVHNKVTKHATPPRRSSRRIFQSVTRDFSRSPPKPSADGLVRPLPKFRSANLLGRETRRITRSPLVSPGKTSTYGRRGNNTIKKSESYVDKPNSPLASVVAMSNDLKGSVADSADFPAPSKMSRLRKNKVFAKFASALSEHFGRQETNQENNAGNGAAKMLSVASNDGIKPFTHGLPLDRLTLNQLPLSDTEASSTPTEHHPNDVGTLEEHKGNFLAANVRAGLAMSQKRLTMIEGSPPLEDPFSEESPRQHATMFEARLKNIQACGVSDGHVAVVPSTDPFVTAGIMDTSDNSILRTPPIGCSTPRVRNKSLIPIQIHTKVARTDPDTATQMDIVPPDGPPTSPSKRRKVAPVCDSPTKLNTSPESGPKEIFSGSPSKICGSSDTTRLSSFPPGSTIRHVPRSMGRLTGVPDLSTSAGTRRKSPKVRRKKHPSPSKKDLDLYGKFMEDSVSLGVFRDPDELAMSLTSPMATNSPALTPRDKNNLLQAFNGSHPNLRKDDNPKDHGSSLVMKSRSRIPQPVSQRARSRTETAFARDFLPVNHGDSTTEDELQWNSSTYMVGRGRGDGCDRCGSMSEAL